MPAHQPRRLTDPDELKALTHPLRQRMITRLRDGGPATSAELAEEFSADRGATSYHLRQLARFGYIEVDEGRSAGRRKYWRIVHQDLRLPEPAEVDEETLAAAEEVGRRWLQDGLDEVARHWQQRGADLEWDGAAMLSSSHTRLTVDELRRFSEEYLDLVRRYSRPSEDAPPDARPVTALFLAFRTPREN